MGRQNKIRHEEFMAKEKQTFDTLRNHSSQKNVKEILALSDINCSSIKKLQNKWINNPHTWNNPHKTKDMDTLRRSLIRFVFVKYPTPKFLETAMLPKYKEERRYNEPIKKVEITNPNEKFIPWFITVAQGGSLYKEHTKGIMTKKETHAFLGAPSTFPIKENIWWAKAYCASNNIGVAGRIARSNLAKKSYDDPFWAATLNFFIRFQVDLSEMNDLLDFISYLYNEDDNYSMNGRSLESVRRRCEEWHRLLNKQKSIGGGTWDGSSIANWSYTQGKGKDRIIWTIKQIKTGKDLLREGQAMRHCVVSYKYKCINGSSSIWSLTSTDPSDNIKRHLTMELTNKNIINQSKGFANRAPRPHEKNIVKRWCYEYDIEYRESYYW